MDGSVLVSVWSSWASCAALSPTFELRLPRALPSEERPRMHMCDVDAFIAFYAIVFVETSSEYVVIAVMHLRRRPGYWLSRLDPSVVLSPEQAKRPKR